MFIRSEHEPTNQLAHGLRGLFVRVGETIADPSGCGEEALHGPMEVVQVGLDSVFPQALGGGALVV